MSDELKGASKGASFLIVNGDCRRVLGDLSRIDAVVTDPPYGIGESSRSSSWVSRPSKWRRRDGYASKEWDAAGQIPVVICGGNYFSLPPSRCWFAWEKPDAPPSMADFEMAWTNRDMNAKRFVWSISATNTERVGHPTQKPVALMRWCIRKLSLKPNSLILDPYMGSGTTLIAALAEGHRTIGIDVDPWSCEIARRRLERPHAPPIRSGRDEPLPLFAGLD